MLTDDLKELMLKSLFVVAEEPEYLFITITNQQSLELTELLNVLENKFCSELKHGDIESLNELKFDLGPLKGCWIAARSKTGSIITFKLSTDRVVGSLAPYGISVCRNFKVSKPMYFTFENAESDNYTLDQLGRAALKRWGARSQVMKMVEESSELSSVLVTLGFGLESFETQEKLAQKVAREICDVENVLIQLAMVWEISYDSPTLKKPEEYIQVRVSKKSCLKALRSLSRANELILSDPTWENQSEFCPTANSVTIFNNIEHAVRKAKQMVSPEILFEERVSKAKKFYKYVKEELCTQQN